MTEHRPAESRSADSEATRNDIDATVALRVPADSAFVAILRSVTAGLAARCDLTLDEIEDLRIAVDEACALLLPLATPGANLSTTFTLRTGQLAISAEVPATDGAQPHRGGFGWTVLQALASEVSVENDAGSVGIKLIKRREPANQ